MEEQSMSNEVMNIQDHINPARITDEQNGRVYELDFSRESIVFAERNHFKLEDALA